MCVSALHLLLLIHTNANYLPIYLPIYTHYTPLLMGVCIHSINQKRVIAAGYKRYGVHMLNHGVRAEQVGQALRASNVLSLTTPLLR